MNISLLTTIFPRYRDDYRGTFIGTLVEVLSQKNKKLKIRVIVPSSKHSLLYEKWGNIKIHRFKYWINQNQQCIAYGDYTLANLKKSIFALIQFPPFYIIIYFLKTLKYWNVTSIFHCQWTITAIFPIVINKLLFFKPDKPIIITCRGSDLRSLPGWLNRFLLKNSIAVTYPSPLFTMSRYNKFIKEDIIKLINKSTPLGVFTIFDPINEEKITYNIDIEKNKLGIKSNKIILWLARFTALKNPLFALQVIRELNKSMSNFCLLMVGDGPEMEKIKKYIDKHKMNSYVKILGFKSDVRKFYTISDMLLATHSQDNVWSSTIAESMMMNCPVALTDVGNTSKVFTNNYDSIFLDSKNIKKSSTAIFKFLEDTKLKKEITENAKNTLKINRRFSYQSVNDYINLYKQALEI